MKIIKRHKYKLERDQLIANGLSEQLAKEFCNYLNKRDNIKLINYFFQVVSDEFEIK